MRVTAILRAMPAGLVCALTVTLAQAAEINVGDWFVGDYTEWNANVYHFDSSGVLIEFLEGFHEPRGMDIGPDGNFYLAHNVNRIVQFLKTDFTVRADVVTAGIDGPWDLEFGPDGNVFLANRDVGIGPFVKRWNGPYTAPAWGGLTNFATLGIGRAMGIAFGPDGNLYVADSEIPGEIARFDGLTGARIGTGPFVNDSAHFAVAFDVAFGPDGNLYVSDRDNSQILAYQGPSNAEPGSYIGTFVSPGSGGLSLPAGIEFGNDGDLYVCDSGTIYVLRYEGPHGASPGAFSGVFTQLGSGRTPWFLTQVPLPPPPPPDRGAIVLVK